MAIEKKVIIVRKSKTIVDPRHVQKYVDLMNGISYSCERFDTYQEGCRNMVAVDLTVGAWMLGLDPIVVLNDFVKTNIIDPLADDESPLIRVNRVLDYAERFDWDWMIDPDGFLSYGDVTEDDVTVFFKLVD